MAFKRIDSNSFVVDSVNDFEQLNRLVKPEIGNECFVIEEVCYYYMTSDGRWIKASKGEGSADAGLTEEDVKKLIPSVDAFITAEEVSEYYIPVKYAIKNCPQDTTIDYRDKEIRIFCHDNAQWQKQNVGEGGNLNMYYMTFRAYAPEGAAYLKEGDRGTIIDEKIMLKGGSGCGVDKHGRAYKDHWFALANYTESTDTWSYFGATSNATKYLGWNYIVEWYDENDNLINTDAIRINLSNKDCHNLLAPYYG